ncbi:MAG: TrkH family potassium uptake protein [Lachnospiraceae bacterium]|nr:TrkH family potassium uptake protein [Lachnospiraceae bacterium]
MEKKKVRFTTTRMIMLGFFIGALAGTALLSLPIASADGKPANFLDALFVATSAICVTGLSTVVTAAQWSLFGQIVILFLIQFGGLGIVTVMTSMLLLFRRRISLSERLLIQEAYNLDTLGGLVRITKSIVKGAMIVEGIGAVFFFFCFVGEYGPRAVWYAIFHSVSAFCNAGLDLVGDSGFVAFQTNLPVNLITMALIVVGGIGFPVWWDVLGKVKRIREKEIPAGQLWRRLSLHTKLAVTMTVTLIVSGAVLYFLFEYNNPDSMGNLSMGEKIMASFFQSVTTRTAGFQTIPQENLTQASGFLTLIFMVIGGSPSSTAGGIKTVTFFVLTLSVISLIRGKKDLEVFGRRLPEFYVRKASAIFSVSFCCMIAATLLLCATQGWTVMEALYEAGSALATVGLSCGKTGDLNPVGKVIITCCMYLGRIGPITLALSLQSSGKRNNRELPEGRVLIG